MTLMQRWIGGKINDLRLFPTDPDAVSHARMPTVVSGTTQPAATPTNGTPGPVSGEEDWIGRPSGFPQDFVQVCRTVFLQMLRVYAHLYHNHFVEPFFHLNLEKQLNSCFSHFILTATSLDMFKKEDLEPVQGLIDLWAASGIFPQESKAYQLADLENGKKILQMPAL